MDFNAPMHALWNYFNGNKTTPSANQTQPQVAIAQQIQQPAMQQGGAGLGSLFKQVAEKPEPDETTIKVYPTIHSLEPTKLNKGTPWAGQEVPTGYIDGLAYAKAKAKSVGGLDEDTLNQFLPLATRESRYHGGTAYGNNGVYVNYKTPPPKDLQGIINQSNTYAKLENDAFDKGNMRVFDEFNKKREGLEAQLLADPRWQSRADSYHKVTKYATDLGLKQTTRQEITRDPKTHEFVGKADVYMANEKDPYAVKALHVPLALYNKRYGEDRAGTGLELTKSFVGGGKEAAARNAQEADIGENIFTHYKNKPLLDYYNSRVEHHASSITKGKK
jgi:hypothetical protein